MARVLVLGDILQDHYKFYENIRNDPATPDIPVVKLVNEVKVAGGAGNLVRNLKELIELEVVFFHGGVPLKMRYYIDDKYVFREDINDEIFHSSQLIDEFVDEIEDNDYVTISDYHKGTVKYSDIKRILNKCNETNITFIDTNHVQPEHEGVDWLKINYETAKESVNISGKDIAKKVSDKTGTNVIVTRGSDGFIAYLRKDDETIYYTKDDTECFVDSIGAGDTFLAGFISALVNKKEVISSMIYADVVAHLSTTKLGTLKVVDKIEADNEYKHIQTTIEENGDTIYVNRSFIDD
tara:strand:- start:255 stop:1139 length:885 start_codon:yes stop_codon:yes gene_type:complete